MGFYLSFIGLILLIQQRDQAAKAKAGKLGQQLRQQKGMTDNEVNKKANEDEAQRRLIEQRAETLNYN